MRRVPLAALLALLAACRGGSAAGDAADEAGQGPVVPAVVGARTARATMHPFTQTIDAIGTVAARPSAFAALSAPAPTRVARIFVAVGERVRRGQPLVEFERAPFDAAARSAEATLAGAERAAERARRLADEGIAPRKEVEQAAVDLAQARAALVTARRAQELATLRAPIAGVVTALGAALGESADPNVPMVAVADPSALDVVLAVTPGQAAAIRAGDSVMLGAGATPGGEPLGTATVTSVAVTVDSAARSVAVRAHAARPTRPLRIGETVFGRIAVAVHPNAVAVPLPALVPQGEGFRVFVVDRDGIAHARPVTVGARSESEAEITSGLRAGEVVVTYGAYGVQDSAKIVRVAP